jgi:hypothetical protein
MTWNDALGNVSYLLIAFSYLVTNMLLRLLSERRTTHLQPMNAC